MSDYQYPFPRLSSTHAVPSMRQLQQTMRNLTERARSAEREAAERIGQLVCGRCGFQAKYEHGRIQLCPCMKAALRRHTEACRPVPPVGEFHDPLKSFYGIPIDVVEPKRKLE